MPIDSNNKAKDFFSFIASWMDSAAKKSCCSSDFLGMPYEDMEPGEEPIQVLSLPKHPFDLPVLAEERNPRGVVTAQPERTPTPKPTTHDRPRVPAPHSSPSVPPRSSSRQATKRHTHNRRLRTAINVRVNPTATTTTGGNPNATSADPRDNWSKSILRSEQLTELFTVIHATLSHVPYVICGLGALYDHGFTARRVTSVSLLCPAYAKDNVRGWLAARGYESFADSVGIPIDGGRVVCRVRVKYLDDGFEGLERVKSRTSEAWILSLASQVDHAAAGYVDHCRRMRKLEQGTGNAGDGQGRAEMALRTIARDVFWCLNEATRRAQHLDPRFLPTLLGEEFWSAFTERHANAKTEMKRAGIDVEGVSERHDAAVAIRDHNAMLKSYGVGARRAWGRNVDDDGDDDEDADGEVKKKPGVFEGMRTLANTRSLYTLKPPDSPLSSGANRPPTSGSISTSAGANANANTNNNTTKPKEKRFTGNLMPDFPITRDSSAETGGLTRSTSVRQPLRDGKASAPPKPRFSEETKRPAAKWV